MASFTIRFRSFFVPVLRGFVRGGGFTALGPALS